MRLRENTVTESSGKRPKITELIKGFLQRNRTQVKKLKERKIIEILTKRPALSGWIIRSLKENDSAARAIALDFLSDLYFSNISEESIENITDELEKYVRSRKHTELHDMVVSFGEKHPDLLCKGIEIDIENIRLSRVVEIVEILAHSLKKRYSYYVNEECFTECRETFLRICHEVADSQEMICLDNETAGTVTFVIKNTEHFDLGPFKGKLPIFWFTLSEEIERIMTRDGSTNLCDEICFAIGKPVKKNIHLVEIRFPSKELNCKCPTIIDGNFQLPFFSVQGNWGNCLDLKEIKAGLREGIHPQTSDFPCDFEVRCLGATSIEVQELTKEQVKKICDILEGNLSSSGFIMSEFIATLAKHLE